MDVGKEKHVCNICGSETESILKLDYKSVIGMAEEYTMIVDYCRGCDYIFTANPFDNKKLANRYTNYSKFEFDNSTYFLGEDDGYKERSKRQKQFIERNLDLTEIKSIFEIGAASGYNLSLYDGIERGGVEPSPVNCKDAKNNYGITLYCGIFDYFYEEKGSKKWDVIFLSHTLEHIVNPCDFIRKCETLCNKYIFIEVPTFDYKFSNEPFGMFAEEHVNMFTLKGLQSLMNKCGFYLVDADIIMCVNQRLPAGFPSMQTLWKKKSVNEKVIPYEVINNTEDLLKRYIQDSVTKLERIKSKIESISAKDKLAIWGTGHHFSMLLANTTLMEKNIVRVYDSDERKKGVKVCGCEVTPFSADDIDKGVVNIILIASFVAQKAIGKNLDLYSDKVTIVKLYETSD